MSYAFTAVDTVGVLVTMWSNGCTEIQLFPISAFGMLTMLNTVPCLYGCLFIMGRTKAHCHCCYTCIEIRSNQGNESCVYHRTDRSCSATDLMPYAFTAVVTGMLVGCTEIQLFPISVFGMLTKWTPTLPLWLPVYTDLTCHNLHSVSVSYYTCEALQ